MVLISTKKINNLKKKKSYITDISSKDLNINNNNLYSYFDKQNISRLDYIIFCLPRH